MAGERPELGGDRGGSGAGGAGRAAIGKVGRKAASWLAASVTGGTSKGVELGVRVGLMLVPLVVVIVIVLGLAFLGAIAGSPAADASTSCDAPPSPVARVTGSEAKRLAELKPIYVGAANQFQLGTNGWAYLAAINRVETDFGLDLSVSSAGAIGWMQFEPSTFAQYAVNVPGTTTDGGLDPYNPTDAIYAAAHLLQASGAPGDWSRAIFSYNHAGWYVSEVTSLAQGFAQGATPQGSTLPASPSSPSSPSECDTVGTTPGATAKITSSGRALAPASAPPAVKQAIAAGNRIIDSFYSQERNPNMLTSVMSSYDCSGSTDYVLYNAGLNAPQVDVGNGIAGTSSLLMSYGERGQGQWITIYANSGHVFIEVAGIVMNTALYAPVHPTSPSSGPRWQPASTIPAQKAGDKFGGFEPRHPAGL